MDKIELSKQTADAILEWVENDNRSNVRGRVLFLWSPFKTFVNSLVSEDEAISKSNHCVNCAIEWATQYETDTEIAKREIEKYVEETLKDTEEGCPVAREFRAIFNGCIDWLDKKGKQ